MDIQALYTSDPDTIAILNAISTNTKVPTDLSFQNQLLLYRNRIFVLRTSPWCLKILTEFHSSPVASHFEFLRTYKRITCSLLWPGIKRDVKLFVASCDVCQWNNYEAIRSSGLLQPLPIPHSVWHDISLDFVKGLPKSVGKNALLVVVDWLIKYGYFVPLTHPFTATKISDTFIKEIFGSMACQKLLSMIMISCSFPIFGTLSSRLKECNYAIAPPIIHRMMVRLKFLIARWNITYAVSSTTNSPLGFIGSRGLSGGTTPHSKLPSKWALTKLSTVFLLQPSPNTVKAQAWFK